MACGEYRRQWHKYENYIVRRLNTNQTQILHRIRLKKYVPNQSFEDNFRDERLQPGEEIVIPQDNLYTISWETNFGDQLATRGNEPIPNSLSNGEQPVTGDDIIVPELSQNDDRKKSLSPRGGKYNLRPNPNPKYSEDFRY